VTERAGGETPDADVEAVAAVVTEYVQAWFAGDGDRIRVVLHPELAKRRGGSRCGLAGPARGPR